MIDTSKTLVLRQFAGLERRFQLTIGQIAELEQTQRAGIGEITDRVITGKFYAGDIWQTLRLGLQGGGMSEVEATALIGRYQREPIIPYVGLASDILASCLAGTPAPKGAEGNGEAEGRQRRRRATSPRSTRPGHP